MTRTAQPSGQAAAQLVAQTFTRAHRETGLIARGLLREDIYTHVRDLIIHGDLGPGQRLQDKEIAQALGVSRTPVREAIRRLQDEGLIVAEASRWTKVAPVTAETADELYPIIGALERLAVMQGSWDHKRLEELSAANQRLAAAVAVGDQVAASQADTQFHQLLTQAAGNHQLRALAKGLKIHIHRVELIYFGGAAAGARSVTEHQAVISALAAGNIPQAADAIEENWRASLRRLHEELSTGAVSPASSESARVG
jgi:DNA-binding GntR family transcriptional regulator